MFKPRLAEGWCAVVPGADRYDIACVSRPPGRRPTLTQLASYRRSGDDADALRRLRRELRLAGRRCTTLLAGGDYRFVALDLPSVPAEELREATRWRVKDMVDLPVESATVDVIEIPESGGTGRARQGFAVVAGNAVISPCMGLFAAARLSLQAIDIAEMAQRNVAALFEEPNRGLAMLGFDAGGGLLSFNYQGELCFVRNIDVSQPQLAAADHARRLHLFERVALDIQRSLDTFDRLNGQIPVTRLLVVPPVEGMAEFLAQSVSVPVEIPDLARVIDCAAAPELRQPARQAECLRVIGAALREE